MFYSKTFLSISLNHLPFPSLTRPLVYPRTHFTFTHSLYPLLAHFLPHSLPFTFTHSLPFTFTHSLYPSLAHVLPHSPPFSFTHSLYPPLAPFLPHSLPFSLKDSLLVWFYFCRREVYHTQRELLRERTRCKALEEELENPMNIHRWRKLEVSGLPCSNFSPLSSFLLLNFFFRLLFYIFFVVSSLVHSFLFLPSSLPLLSLSLYISLFCFFILSSFFHFPPLFCKFTLSFGCFQGSDPSTYEMIQKIQTLQKRLIQKTEEVKRTMDIYNAWHTPHILVYSNTFPSLTCSMYVALCDMYTNQYTPRSPSSYTPRILPRILLVVLVAQ